MTGNRALFKIKGQTVGAAQNVSCSDDFGLQDVDGLGDVEAVELVVGKITHTISGEKYFVNADTLRALGIVPTSAEWLTAPELEIEIIDTVSGGTVELYTGAKFATHSRKYSKHTIVGEDFTIRAMHKST
jgi:hypothetical protein